MYALYDRRGGLYTGVMLSLLPQLLFLAPFSAFLIRIAIAVVITLVAWEHLFQHEKNFARWFGAVEAILAAFLVIGLYTQLTAICAILTVGAWKYRLGSVSANLPESTLWLLLIMCISLIVTGPGVFAFDLPL